MHEMGISHRNKEWLAKKMTLEELQKMQILSPVTV